MKRWKCEREQCLKNDMWDEKIGIYFISDVFT